MATGARRRFGLMARDGKMLGDFRRGHYCFRRLFSFKEDFGRRFTYAA